VWQVKDLFLSVEVLRFVFPRLLDLKERHAQIFQPVAEIGEKSVGAIVLRSPKFLTSKD
jgi:hypothetical protein